MVNFNFNYAKKCHNQKCGFKPCINKKISTFDYDHNQFNNAFEYVKCDLCSTIYFINGPSPDELGDVYPSSYGAYQKSNFGLIGSFARKFAAFFKLRRIKKYHPDAISFVAEFGCGANPLVTFLNIEPTNIYLIDHQINQDFFPNHSCIKLDGNTSINKLLDDGIRFDIIVFNQLIEHLSDPIDFLNNCHKLLNDNGIIYFETPNFNGWECDYFLESGLWGGLHAPRHNFVFNFTSITSLLDSTKFSLISRGSLLNPFILNQSLRAYFIHKERKSFLWFFKLSNPVVLFGLLFSDIFQLMFGRKTGNAYFIAKKKV